MSTGRVELTEQEMELKKVELYTKMIKNNQDESNSFKNRGLAYSKLNEFDKAIQDLSKAIEIDPSPTNYNWRGFVFSGMKEPLKAAEDFSKAIEGKNISESDRYAYLHNRGFCFIDLRLFEQAEKDITNALSIVGAGGNKIDSYNNRGCAYNGIGEYLKAIQDCKKALELSKTDIPNTNAHLGNSFRGLKKYRKAFSYFETAIRLKPEYPKTHFFRALAYLETGKFDEAIIDLKRCIELNPYYKIAQLTLTDAMDQKERENFLFQFLDEKISVKLLFRKTLTVSKFLPLFF